MAIENWARTHHEEGGGDALVAFWVFGDLGGELAISHEKHRVSGMPGGVGVHRIVRGTEEGDQLFASFTSPGEGPISARLDEDPALAAAVRASRCAYRVLGTVEDPDDLLYLRDVIGIVQAMLETGGVAVADQALHWWSAERWRSEVFAPDAPRAATFVSLLGSQNDDGTVWLHTRGMRLFGRPDVSVPRVTGDQQAAAADLAMRLVNMQAMGGVVPDGQPVKMKGIPSGWTCKHAGNVDDPDFNNVHLAIGPA